MVRKEVGHLWSGVVCTVVKRIMVAFLAAAAGAPLRFPRKKRGTLLYDTKGGAKGPLISEESRRRKEKTSA